MKMFNLYLDFAALGTRHVDVEYTEDKGHPLEVTVWLTIDPGHPTDITAFLSDAAHDYVFREALIRSNEDLLGDYQ